MSTNTVMRRLAAVFAGALLSLTLGCGTDDEGGNKEVARDGARSSVDSALALKDIKGDGNDEASVGKVAGMYGHLQKIAVANAASNSGGSGIPGTGVGALSAALSAEWSPDCVSKQDKTVTYEDCNLQGVSLSGTMTLDGNNIKFDLNLAVDVQSYTVPEGSGASEYADMLKEVKVHEVGDMTITLSDIDGVVDVDVTTVIDTAAVAEAAGISTTIPGVGNAVPSEITQTMKATFDVQMSSEPPCASGGTITVQNTGSAGVATTGDGSTTTATFGPECGDVTIE